MCAVSLDGRINFFDMNKKGNLKKLLQGDKVGTLVTL